jgi:hypothetical protein
VPSELVHEKGFLTFVEKGWAFQVKLQLGGGFFFPSSGGYFVM